MKELNYNNHKWVKRLVDYNNTKFARHVNKGETKPKTLCALFVDTFLTTGSMLLVSFAYIVLTALTIALIVAAIGLAIIMLGTVIVPYLPYESLHYDFETAALMMIVWGMAGGLTLVKVRRHFIFSISNSVWTTPLTKLYREWKDEREQKKEIVDKQPSLIIEYIKALKNKVCPIITYDEEAND